MPVVARPVGEPTMDEEGVPGLKAGEPPITVWLGSTDSPGGVFRKNIWREPRFWELPTEVLTSQRT